MTLAKLKFELIKLVLEIPGEKGHYYSNLYRERNGHGVSWEWMDRALFYAEMEGHLDVDDLNNLRPSRKKYPEEYI